MPAKSQKKHKAAATVAATKEPEAEPVKAVAVVEAAPADKKKKGKGKLTSSEVAPAPAEVEKRVQEPTSQEQPKPEHTQHGEKAAAANKGTRGEKTGKKRERDGRTKAVSEEDHQAGSKRPDPRVANPVLTYTTQQWAEKAAAALMAVASREDADRSLLFADERLVKLQVVHTSGHLLPRGKMDVYVQLPYPLHDQRTSSGVLLVRDENIQKQMEALNIPGVTKVINYKTYHATYNTPELVQSLVNAHEVFMADRIVLPLLQLGPLVLRNRVLFHVDCLSRPAQDVAVAFRSTGVKLESRWLFANVVIGRSDASPQQLADNAMAVLESLCAHIPLGWKAIRSVSMKIDGTDVPPLPVYTRPEEVEATMREESAALEKEVAARLEEDKKVELEFRHKRNEQRRKDRDDLRLVYSRWEAFRKAPHLFGESPPEEKPEPERQGEAAEAVDAAASTTDATNNANEVAAGADTGAVEEPAKKRKKGPKKVA